MKKYLFILLIFCFFTSSFAQIPPGCEKILTPSILKALEQYGSQEKLTSEQEKQIFDKLWEFKKNNTLEASVTKLVMTLKDQIKIPAFQKMPTEYIVGSLMPIILAEFYARGYHGARFAFAQWDIIENKINQRFAKLPTVNDFQSVIFRKVLKTLTGSSLMNVKEYELISDNKKALEKRLEMIQDAKTSLYLVSWGFYDDVVGEKIANALISAKVDRNIDVKILVDGLIKNRTGYHAQLDRLAQAGVEVIGWASAVQPFTGMHSKMLIADEIKTIEGGRNIGDVYLQADSWSDMDIYHRGQLTEKFNVVEFKKIWNQQVKQQALNYELFDHINAPYKANIDRNFGSMIVLPSNKKSGDIYDLTLYAINNAKKEIDIANAYFISTPPLKKAIENALKRGVVVRILSNSTESVDEPIVSVPIQESLLDMAKMGAKIYLKKGKTLHTKTFRADDFSWIGSYNFHPRSNFYEMEKIVFSTSSDFNQKIKAEFKLLIDEAIEVKDSKEIVVPQLPGLNHFFNLIFNQL